MLPDAEYATVDYIEHLNLAAHRDIRSAHGSSRVRMRTMPRGLATALYDLQNRPGQ